MQDDNAKNNDEINKIKIANLDLEKEVGGFRFVAEAFGMELKNVVKFFIFLIVIVFDPLAVALIIAFNGLIETKKQKQSRLLGEMMKNDQKLGLYEVYGDTKEDIVENISQNTENSEKIPTLEVENGVNDGNILQNEPANPISVPYYEDPSFDWENKNLWINNPSAVKYWMNSGNSINNFKKLYKQHLDELDNNETLTKTY